MQSKPTYSLSRLFHLSASLSLSLTHLSLLSSFPTSGKQRSLLLPRMPGIQRKYMKYIWFNLAAGLWRSYFIIKLFYSLKSLISVCQSWSSIYRLCEISPATFHIHVINPNFKEMIPVLKSLWLNIESIL